MAELFKPATFHFTTFVVRILLCNITWNLLALSTKYQVDLAATGCPQINLCTLSLIVLCTSSTCMSIFPWCFLNNGKRTWLKMRFAPLFWTGAMHQTKKAHLARR